MVVNYTQKDASTQGKLSPISKMETNTNSKDKQKAMFIALLMYAFVLIILFFIRFWPPSNISELVAGGGGVGVEINFGNTDFGMGDNLQNKILVIKNDNKTALAPENPTENILTDENSTNEAAITTNKEPLKKTKTILKNETKPVTVIKPKVISNSALNNLLKGSKNGDGNSKIKGNQGKNTGNINSNGYDLTENGNGNGNGEGDGSGVGKGKGKGLGNGSGYLLGNRKATSKPKPDSSCSNETGKIVVEVTVDKNGNTISAVVGKRGTDIGATCLRNQAKQAALATKWAPSPNGTEQQTGEIIYAFGLN